MAMNQELIVVVHLALLDVKQDMLVLLILIAVLACVQMKIFVGHHFWQQWEEEQL